MGYEIKYSMSALFWSPPPSSTLTVPTGRGDGGGGGVQEGRRRDRSVEEGVMKGKKQMRRKEGIVTVLVKQLESGF